MSRKLQRVMSLAIAVFVAFGMMAVGTGEASAATGKVKLSIYSIAGENRGYVGEEVQVDAYNTKNKAVTIKSVKVSDKTIAKVKKTTIKYKGKKYKLYKVVGKTPGKVTLTVKYKCNGKVATKKKTIRFVKYPEPIQSLEVNGKSIKLSGQKKFYYGAKYSKSKTSVKVKIVPAEGWKITDVLGDTHTLKGTKYKYANIKKVKTKVKNGTSISFPKKYNELQIGVLLENENGKDIWYDFYLYR